MHWARRRPGGIRQRADACPKMNQRSTAANCYEHRFTLRDNGHWDEALFVLLQERSKILHCRASSEVVVNCFALLNNVARSCRFA